MLSINKYNLLKNSILLFLLLFLCTANGNAETVDINGTSYDITTLIDRDLGPGINYKRIRLADFPPVRAIAIADGDFVFSVR